jgi:hypothetical protein
LFEEEEKLNNLQKFAISSSSSSQFILHKKKTKTHTHRSSRSIKSALSRLKV